MANDLARDLYRLLQDVAAPVATALRSYASVSVHALGRLGPELAFLLGGVRLAERLRSAGLPTCRPEQLAADLRSTELVDAYDPVLALRLLAGGDNPGAIVVTNPVALAAKGARVWVLSGPNRGGKTTYIRAVGLAHVLGQAGLHPAARSARLSSVDAIVTHFPSRESSRPGMGRLDDEAERLGAIFRQATPHSLVLLNEALAGTSSFEAVDLARGAVRGLRFLGARAIYVTHLHELSAAVADINATTPGDALVGSLVAEPGAEPTEGGHVQIRTFRILPGAPDGQTSPPTSLSSTASVFLNWSSCCVSAASTPRIAESVLECLRFLLTVLNSSVCQRHDLVVENLLLRHQLAVLTRPTRTRPRARRLHIGLRQPAMRHNNNDGTLGQLARSMPDQRRALPFGSRAAAILRGAAVNYARP